MGLCISYWYQFRSGVPHIPLSARCICRSPMITTQKKQVKLHLLLLCSELYQQNLDLLPTCGHSANHNLQTHTAKSQYCIQI